MGNETAGLSLFAPINAMQYETAEMIKKALAKM